MRLVIAIIFLLVTTSAYATVPNAPSALVLVVSGQRVDASWTLNGGSETYVQVERRIGAADFLAVKDLPAGTVKWYDTSVSPSTSYDYQVRACNIADGCSAASTAASASVLAAPTAVGSLTVPATAFTNETIIIDGRGSTNFCKRPQPDGTTSITLNFGDGFTANLLASAHRYKSAGSYTVTLNGKNCSGVAATQVSAGIVISDIPAATGGAIQILTNTGNASTNHDNLNAAIAIAAAANSVEQEIVLPCPFIASKANAGIEMITPTGSKYITIKSACLTVPQDKRVTPATMANAPQILTDTGYIIPGLTTPITAPASPPHHYRIQGIHLAKNNPTVWAGSLLNVGQPANTQDVLSKIPHHFIIERCWFDGDTGNTSRSKDGIRIHGDYVTVIDSYFAEFKDYQFGPDPTAISVPGGRGPIGIWNNYLVADSESFHADAVNEAPTATVSSPTNTSATLSNVTNLAVDENIAFQVGGYYSSSYSTIVRSINVGTGAITFDPITTPPDNAGTAKWNPVSSFLEYRRNYSFKPLKWNPDDPSYIGFNQNNKNLWEAKNGKYMVIDGNVFENNWLLAQPFALVIGSNNCQPQQASTLREVQISNNVARNAHSGWLVNGSDNGGNGTTCGSSEYSDFALRNNLFWKSGVNADPEANTTDVLSLPGANAQLPSAAHLMQLQRVYFIHNTHDNGPVNAGGKISELSFSCILRTGGGALDSMWFNNLHQDGGYGFANQFSGCGGDPYTGNFVIAIKTFFQPGDATVHTKNLIYNVGTHVYPATDLTASATWTTGIFTSHANGNFVLQGGTPGKNASTDGSDIGADMTAIKTAIGAPSYNFGTDWSTTNVITGDWTGTAPTSGVCKWNTSPACAP